MDLSIHPLAARDARRIAGRYSAISCALESRFWSELDAALDEIETHPAHHHFDASGFRRVNLRKFPYHVLFEEHLDVVRVLVIRHHHRNPTYGLRRK
jgi:plasmid stabilization system protein ParE